MTTPPDAADGADRVDVWVIPTDRPAPVVRRLRRLLDHTEPDRAGAGQDRERSDRFTVVHGAVRLLTSDRLGTLPAAPEWRHGPHGKPEPVADGSRLLLALWCRREACVKAYGGRLVQGLGMPLTGPGPLRPADAGPLGQGPCWVRDVPVPEEFRAAVAVDGARPFLLRSRRWTAPADHPAPSARPSTAL